MNTASQAEHLTGCGPVLEDAEKAGPFRRGHPGQLRRTPHLRTRLPCEA
jgi:hypothetical protein